MAETLSETGLVTAAVNPPDPLAPSPVIAPEQMPDGWTIHRVAALVRDLAMNFYDLPVTLTKYNLTEAQYAVLAENKFFQNALEAAIAEWNSPLSTNKRLAMETAMMLEDALPTIGARMTKANEPLTGIVELAKLFAKIAGAGEAAQTGAPSEKFKIVINLGADVAQFEKQRAPIQIVTGSEEKATCGGTATIQALLEGPSLRPKI